jgi:hypothetical protein
MKENFGLVYHFKRNPGDQTGNAATFTVICLLIDIEYGISIIIDLISFKIALDVIIVPQTVPILALFLPVQMKIPRIQMKIPQAMIQEALMMTHLSLD